MEENLIRAADGKIHLDSNDELDYDKDGTPLTGFGDNFWVGLHVFHTIFAREHNYIIDSLSVVYPGMTSDEKWHLQCQDCLLHFQNQLDLPCAAWPKNRLRLL